MKRKTKQSKSNGTKTGTDKQNIGPYSDMKPRSTGVSDTATERTTLHQPAYG